MSVNAEATSRLVWLLRDEAERKTMLCTPSVLREQESFGDALLADASSSWSIPGAVFDQTGCVAETAALLADLHGADHAIVVTDGSTGGNQTALGAYARLVGERLFLIDRQSHHSVPFDLTRQGLDWGYVAEGGWDCDWDAPSPLTASAVEDALVSAPKPVGCLVVTAPTYLGQWPDLAAIARVAHAHGALVHVDAAWAAHAPFLPELERLSAMRAGADTATISVHKQAGCLQPGAALLARTERVPVQALRAAYEERASTSQSLLVAASIDASQRYLAVYGAACFGRVVTAIAGLKERLRERLDVTFFDEVAPGPHDPTKLTVSLDRYAISGYELAAALEERGIVAEKATPRTITFLGTLAVEPTEIEQAADAVVAVLSGCARRTSPPPALANPYVSGDAMPALSPTFVARHAVANGSAVPAAEAVGCVAAERIEAYPPGIALVMEGFRVTAGALEWLAAVRRAGGVVRALDPTLETILILPE